MADVEIEAFSMDILLDEFLESLDFTSESEETNETTSDNDDFTSYQTQTMDFSSNNFLLASTSILFQKHDGPSAMTQNQPIRSIETSYSKTTTFYPYSTNTGSNNENVSLYEDSEEEYAIPGVFENEPYDLASSNHPFDNENVLLYEDSEEEYAIPGVFENEPYDSVSSNHSYNEENDLSYEDSEAEYGIPGVFENESVDVSESDPSNQGCTSESTGDNENTEDDFDGSQDELESWSQD